MCHRLCAGRGITIVCECFPPDTTGEARGDREAEQRQRGGKDVGQRSVVEPFVLPQTGAGKHGETDRPVAVYGVRLFAGTGGRAAGAGEKSAR